MSVRVSRLPGLASVPRGHRVRAWVAGGGALLLGMLAAEPPLAAATLGTVDGVKITWLNDIAATAIDQWGGGTTSYDGYGDVSSETPLGAAGRVDWLSELELDDGDVGLRASAAAALGEIYDRPARLLTLIPSSGGGDYVASPSPSVEHDQIEFLDAFLHASFPLDGDQRLSLRLGRHTLLWGESLFFPENGVAAGQAPVDTTREPDDDSYRSKALYLPVGQASFAWQPGSDIALEGYYQFEYRQNRLSAAGTYAAIDDLLGPADQRAFAGAWGPVAYARGSNVLPASTDQLGLAIKWQAGDLDLGVYGLSYDAKSPIPVFHPPAGDGYWNGTGTYDLRYPTGIQIFGVSAAGFIGDANFGAELSGRRDMPLVTAGILVPAGSSADATPPFPTGDTLNGQLSFTEATQPLPGIPAGANWSGEIAFNHLISARNADHLMPGRTPDAVALRTVFEPQFFQVVPRVDLTLPLGVGWNVLGRSSIDSTMNRGSGDIDLGATLRVDQAWKGALRLTHYFGRSKALYLPYNPTNATDPLAAGDYVAFTIERAL